MTFKPIASSLVVTLAFTTFSTPPAHGCQGDANSYFQIKSVTTVRAVGGRVDWSKALDLIAYDDIAYDNKDQKSHFQVYVMKPDGSDDRCITCGRADVPQFVNGQPAWDPSGKYLVFQSAFKGSSPPGAGVNADLWVYSFEEDKFTQLTFLESFGEDGQHGVLHAHFSHDGTRLSWSEMYRGINRNAHGELGYWRINVAEFSITPSGIKLESTQAIDTGTRPGFYENHGFLPNDAGLVFSSNYESLPFVNRIYRFGFQRSGLVQLIRSGYNEHAEFSPDGSYIMWMSNLDNRNKGTDLWAMGPWGGNKERITFFNDPNCPEYFGTTAIMSDHSFSADGKKLAVYMHEDARDNPGVIGSIVILEAY